MVVYVDILFLTNFVLDFSMLIAAAKIRGIRPSLWRVAAASAIGALYVLFMFVPSLSIFYTFVVKCLFSAVMIMTAFGYKTLGRFLGLLAAFYAVSATAAGAVLGFHYLLQSTHEVWDGILFIRSGGYQHVLGISLWFIVTIAIAGIAGFRKVNAGAKRKEMKTQFLAPVEVQIDGETFRCTGLIDTGNHLYDPLTRTPVMVMEASVWKQEIPATWLEAIKAHEADKIVSLLGEGDAAAASESGFESRWRDRIRLVPYRGINGGARFMLAVKPDKVTVERGGQLHAAEKVLVGIDGGKLSSDGLYQAIIHPALVPESPES